MLEALILQEIQDKGPMRQDRFMELALGHPTHGYYRTQEAVSQDFTTAPEVSQMFCELIGAWVLDLYDKLGRPDAVTLVELGPGRGTLMSDVLRVTSSLSDIFKVFFVEINPLLKDIQKSKVPNAEWAETFEEVPQTSNPLIIIGNEFLDALPTRCYLVKENRLYERCIEIEKGNLTFVEVPQGTSIEPNGIWEECPAANHLLDEISTRLHNQSGAFLCIDYGYETGEGDSLQALYDGKPIHPLRNPGHADLTCHVNFKKLKEKALSKGLGVAGPLTQGAFLLNMGLDVRLEMLKHKNPTQRGNLELAAMRLTHPHHMGTLFKTMALFSPSSLKPIGFETCS